MKCPQCKKNYCNIIGHLKNHGYTAEEAERLLYRSKDEHEVE